MLLKSIGNTEFLILVILSYLAPILLIGCANQKPPGGGEEDKLPPKLEFLRPEDNSLNFKGKSIIIGFDEYIDKRSFQESFHISPPYTGDVTFEWSGKEVEIVFEEPLVKSTPDKTFVVSINSTLTDIRGNKLTSPISFAFSTGPKIDMAGITGRVFDNEEKPISILAYRLGMDESDFDPSKNIADYVTESSSEGSYKLTNLSPGKYRIIAVQDDDRNLLYTAERENFGVLAEDVIIEDSVQLSGVNFILKKTEIISIGEEGIDVSGFFKDTAGIVSSSIESNTRSVLPDQSIFIFFNSHKPSRDDFVKSFAIKDANGNSEKVVYSWTNDSLVEIIPPAKFAYNSDYELSFKLEIMKDSVYNYSLKFRTVSVNSFGEIKGSIRKTIETGLENVPVYIKLISLGLKPEIRYSFNVSDTVFNLENIFEADYSLFAFVDRNFNGIYDYGNPYPFGFSEQFFIHPQTISTKGGWAIENVIINFK